jgi:hypothetical protein
MALSSFGMQGVSISPRHFFGVNTEIKGGLFLTDEDKHLIYPSGHNVIMYKVDDKE